MQLATPLTSKVNLRVGVGGFSFNPNLVEDGFAVVGNIQLMSVFAGWITIPSITSMRACGSAPG